MYHAHFYFTVSSEHPYLLSLLNDPWRPRLFCLQQGDILLLVVSFILAAEPSLKSPAAKL